MLRSPAYPQVAACHEVHPVADLLSLPMDDPAEMPSRFDDAMQAEYRALAASIAAQRERAERLQDLADHARAQAEQDERALSSLAGVLGLGPQMCLELLDDRLRGHRLQEIAVRVLAKHRRPGESVHYKQWYGLLREAGYTVGGKDPLATFLASVSRSPHVRGVGQRSGLYVLRGGADPDPDAAEEPAQPAASGHVSIDRARSVA